MDDLSGQEIRGYKLIERIGEGGFGVVYRAEQPSVNREVAIKVILPEYADHPEFEQRFEVEARTVARLEHPHIVPLYDYWRDDEGAFLVMRWLRGGSLRVALESGPTQIDDAGRWLEQIAEALSVAHQQGVIHRDLKPGNILLDEVGNAYLTDFGIAKDLSVEGLTQTGKIVGSVDYLAPEQAKGEKVTPKTDIYALGVLLYEMLVGEHPFPGLTTVQKIQKHLNEPLPSISETHPEIPIGLDIVIQRATAKDPDVRYLDTLEMANAYQQVLALDEAAALADQDPIHLKCKQLPEKLDQLVVEDSDLPAIPPHNLPSELTPFVGRERELEALEAMIANPEVRLITILGAGGMGKTRLALAFADSQISATHRTNGKTEALYPHGIYFNQLAPLESIDSIVPTVAETLGFRLSEKRDPQKQLLDHLRGKEMLLIFDNYEHLLDGTGFVIEILKSAPGVKVLATSRTRLNIGGEHRFQLEGLDLPENIPQSTGEAVRFSSIELFHQCAGRAQEGFKLSDENVNYVVRICHLLEGMPLGVRLAAAWVNILSPAEIAEEIERGLDLLETEVRDIPDRHCSIRAIFDHSWNLLSDKECEVLGGLSVFRGGFTRNGAEQITGASLRDLKTLVNKSLVNPSPNQRFEMHGLLRQYIAEKLVDFPEKTERMNERHCAYYMAFVEERDRNLKGARQHEALQEIENDHANVRTAWGYATKMGQVYRLYQGVDGLCRFYLWRRRYQEGETACRAVTDSISIAPSDQRTDLKIGEKQRLLARILTWQSGFCEHAKANALVEKALNVLNSSEMFDLDIRKERAFALQQLGDLTIDFDRDEAQRIYEQSLTLYQELEDTWGTSRLFTALGWVSSHKGELQEAKLRGVESLGLQRSIGDQKGIADTLWLLGTNAIIGGSVEKATQLILKSLDIRQAMGDRIIDIASGPVDLGMTLTWIGCLAEAKEVREETLAMYQEQGLTEEIATAHVRLATSYLHLGEYDKTSVHANVGLTLGRETENLRAIGLAMLQLGCCEYIKEKYEEAYRLFKESVSNLRSIEGAGELGWLLSALALGEHTQGESHLARSYLYEAFQIGRGILSTVTAWIGISVFAVILSDEGYVNRGLELFKLSSRYPLVAKSRFFTDVFSKTIGEAASTLSDEIIAEAEAKGKARDLHDTIAELITELEVYSQE
jgi:serine/threonine protein kinase/predicted ATPase